MKPTNRTTIPTRVSQCLAAAGFMTGLAFGSAAVASAEPVEWDIEKYDDCIRARNPVDVCCWDSGGVLTDDGKGGYKCQAQTLQTESAETGVPPVLQNPPGQIAPPPVITVPRGPNSGTVG